MINITLSDLEACNLYASVLQTVETICDNYELQNDFGIISSANQEVVDFILNGHKDFSVNVEFNIDNDHVDVLYSSADFSFDCLYNKVIEEEHSILSLLCDNIEYDSDNKVFTINFHVKPKMFIVRKTQTENVLKTKFSL
ncbi:MAG: hypothetical protein MJZ57_02915 [Bacteroidales bacterium]|nr:hypothetical protein [Bacteroidales bacterium]